jgi:hypothetical protein
MAIMSYSDEKDETAIYGLMLLPVAIVFIVYAMYQCTYHIESFGLAQQYRNDLLLTNHVFFRC